MERCAKSEAEIAKSLQGHYKPEHVFILRQALELYDSYDQQVQRCDAALEALSGQFGPPEDPGTPSPAPRPQKRRKNQVHFELALALYRMSGEVDLTQIDGVDELTITAAIHLQRLYQSDLRTTMHSGWA